MKSCKFRWNPPHPPPPHFHLCKVLFHSVSAQKYDIMVNMCGIVWYELFVISSVTLMNVAIFTRVLVIFLLDSVECIALGHPLQISRHRCTGTQKAGTKALKKNNKRSETKEDELMPGKHVAQEHMLLCRTRI